MPQGAVSNGKHIDAFIPYHLRDMFYRHPTRPYAWNNGLDPYGFSTDGLVLYLPLWALKNSSFQSIDAYKHTCTVTGALWQPDGRLFDGSDDRITVPDHASLQFEANDDFTLIIWIEKTGGANTERLLQKTSGDANPRFVISLQSGVGSPSFYGITDAVPNAVAVSGTTAMNDGPHMLSLSVDRDNASGFVAYVDDATEGAAQDPTGVGDLSNVGVDVTLGEFPNGVGDFTGTIGEAWIYSRAFVAAEITRHNNITAWRYQ